MFKKKKKTTRTHMHDFQVSKQINKFESKFLSHFKPEKDNNHDFEISKEGKKKTKLNIKQGKNVELMQIPTKFPSV